MAALTPDYMVILKKILRERFVDLLPPLLDTKPAAEQQEKQLSRAFSAFALHKLLDLAPAEASAAVVDDFNDNGIDAIYYHAPSETLYLLQSKLKSGLFSQEDSQSFCEGVRLLLKQKFDGFNQNVQRRQAEIVAALDTCCHIYLVVPYTSDGVSQHAADALLSLLNDEDLDEPRLIRQVKYYSAVDIRRDLLAEKAYPRVDADVYLQKVGQVQEPRATYYGLARLSDLVALHELHGKALYERNIRYFLGSSKSDVNAAIQATLRDAPGNFFYLNNGITAVCDVVEPKSKNAETGFKKYVIRGLSIINGAQTVASAAEFVRQHPQSDIKSAKVLFTLIKAPAAGEFGQQVTRARNHQNPVHMGNFAALDENQERLRQEIGLLGFDYHYRPEAQEHGTEAIVLDEAARALALLQSDPRYVVWLKADPARLSNSESSEYKRLFSTTLPGSTLVNAVLCQRVMRSLLQESEQHAPARSHERSIYRHGIYVIMAVMQKQLSKLIQGGALLDADHISAVVSRPLDELRQRAVDLWQEQHLGEGTLAFFKAMDRTTPFLITLMKKHYGLENFQEERSPERLGRLAQDGISLNQDLVERLSKAAPQLKESKK